MMTTRIHLIAMGAAISTLGALACASPDSHSTFRSAGVRSHDLGRGADFKTSLSRHETARACDLPVIPSRRLKFHFIPTSEIQGAADSAAATPGRLLIVSRRRLNGLRVVDSVAWRQERAYLLSRQPLR